MFSLTTDAVSLLYRGKACVYTAGLLWSFHVTARTRQFWRIHSFGWLMDKHNTTGGTDLLFCLYWPMSAVGGDASLCTEERLLFQHSHIKPLIYLFFHFENLTSILIHPSKIWIFNFSTTDIMLNNLEPGLWTMHAEWTKTMISPFLTSHILETSCVYIYF